jgi:hypothetical protein
MKLIQLTLLALLVAAGSIVFAADAPAAAAAPTPASPGGFSVSIGYTDLMWSKTGNEDTSFVPKSQWTLGGAYAIPDTKFSALLNFGLAGKKTNGFNVDLFTASAGAKYQDYFAKDMGLYWNGALQLGYAKVKDDGDKIPSKMYVSPSVAVGYDITKSISAELGFAYYGLSWGGDGGKVKLDTGLSLSLGYHF